MSTFVFVLGSRGCYLKVPQTEWLHMTTTYYLTALEAKSINQDISRTKFPVVCWDGISLSLCFFLALVAQEFLAYSNITSITVSIFRQPLFSLCSLSSHSTLLFNAILMRTSDMKVSCSVPIWAWVIRATGTFSDKGIFWDTRRKKLYYTPPRRQFIHRD